MTPELIIAILGSSAVTGIITHTLGRKERKTSTAKSSIHLTDQVDQMVVDRLEQNERMQLLVADKEAAEFALRVKTAQHNELMQHLQVILIEQGKADERERQCQAAIKDLKARVKALEELDDVNRKQASVILQMKAKLDEYEGSQVQ